MCLQTPAHGKFLNKKLKWDLPQNPLNIYTFHQLWSTVRPPPVCNPGGTSVVRGLILAHFHQYPTQHTHKLYTRKHNSICMDFSMCVLYSAMKTHQRKVAVLNSLSAHTALPENWLMKTRPQEVQHCTAVDPTDHHTLSSLHTLHNMLLCI